MVSNGSCEFIDSETSRSSPGPQRPDLLFWHGSGTPATATSDCTERCPLDPAALACQEGLSACGRLLYSRAAGR